MSIVRVDYSKCSGCKKCYSVCPIDVFTWDEQENKPVVAYDEECWACGICWMDCASRAIDMHLPATNW